MLVSSHVFLCDTLGGKENHTLTAYFLPFHGKKPAWSELAKGGRGLILEDEPGEPPHASKAGWWLRKLHDYEIA